MGKRNYVQRTDGERIDIDGRAHIIRCCDCGLVHLFRFRVAKGRLSFRAWRQERATAASRRSLQYKRRVA